MRITLHPFVRDQLVYLAGAWLVAVGSPSFADALLVPGELTVRGSVEQIHIIHAPPNTHVEIRGPEQFDTEGTTDRLGGLIVRDVPPGAGYSVRIEGISMPVPDVRVLGRDEHPSADFYRGQKLSPTAGYIRTRDGTLLAYRVKLPDPAKFGDGPYDLIITYSGYQPAIETGVEWQDRPFDEFTAEGYAVAGVNMRGSGPSGGAFNLLEPLTWLDGYDVIEAFSAQGWVEDVALGDQSWPGLTQLFVASTQPPSLDAIVPGAVVGDFYRDIFYPGGIRNDGFGKIWAAGRDAENTYPSSQSVVNERIAEDPVAAANQGLRGQNQSLVDAIAAHPFYDEYWRVRNAERLVGHIRVPCLQIVSWQDMQCGGRPAMLTERYHPDVPVRFIGTNGFHTYYEGDVWAEILRFLDVYLRDGDRAAYEAEEPVLILLEKNNEGFARARFTLPSLGIAGDGRRYQLAQDLIADEGRGDASRFTYDPTAYKGLRDMGWDPTLQDRVIFTSAVLEKSVLMAGPGSADLWIAAQARDVDLQVTLTELRPDGKEMLIQSGWLRASHRALDEQQSSPLRPRQVHTAATRAELRPGQPALVRIELFPFAHLFRAGSRIRVSVAGPGGGGNSWPWDLAFLPGGFEVTVLHDADHPSRIILPVIEVAGFQPPSDLPPCDQVSLQPCWPR